MKKKKFISSRRRRYLNIKIELFPRDAPENGRVGSPQEQPELARGRLFLNLSGRLGQGRSLLPVVRLQRLGRVPQRSHDGFAV